MDFRRQGHRNARRLALQKTAEPYLESLQFYTVPPVDKITLKEFEDFAVERLQLLRILERTGIQHIRNSKEYRDTLIGDLQKQNMWNYARLSKLSGSEEIRRRDYISHFVLRMAYCRTEELRRWFLAHELDLFRFRFEEESLENKKHFLEQNKLDYSPISEDEKSKIINSLIQSSNSFTRINTDKRDFYKVPFIAALDLVRARRVYLHRGYAYIPDTDLVSIVLGDFHNHLSRELAVTARALPQLEEESRVLNVLSGLNQRYVGKDYSRVKTENSGIITPDMIDSLAKSSFPLCMRSLHENLRQHHHLRHGGRMQYGLFLKGIGLSLEDAMTFWREAFAKGKDGDNFDKKFAYSIRHNYGTEGKRANYMPYSCMKIILSNAPGPEDCHGCPFKHWDATRLRQKMQSLHLGAQGSQDVLDLVGKGHYQIACTRYFELTHNGESIDQGLSHPNQYFEVSRQVMTGTGNNRNNKDVSQPVTVRSVMMPSQNSTDDTLDTEMSLTQEEMDAIMNID